MESAPFSRYRNLPRASETGRPFLDRFWLAPALLRLAELYENAGDVRHATEYYGRFVDLWKNADPELQPRVTRRGRESTA